MPSLNYEAVEALVYDPVAANRGAMRAALSTLGFRHVDCVNTPEDFSYAAFRCSPDIVFCEISSEDKTMCERLQAVRQGLVGNNPFVAMVATTWDKSETLIRRVINLGADDLLLRPFSTGILSSRLETLAVRRKGFVITHDYIGPDRRRDPARIATGLFEPPNAFGIKAATITPLNRIEARLHREVSVAKTYLFGEKLRVDVFQIGVLSRLLQQPGDGEALAEYCHRIVGVTTSVMTRGATAKKAGVELWGKEILAAVRGVSEETNRTDTFRFLDMAIANLYQIVDPSKPNEIFAADLEKAVAVVRARIAAGKPV